MADVFASSKRPSLFPVAIPSPKISKEDYHTFYKDERALFTIFIAILHRDVVESTFVIGFLLWLERERYSSFNPVGMIVNSFKPHVINQLADEVVICFKFMQKNLMSNGSSKSYKISLLQFLVDRKRLHLDELYQNGDMVSDEVCCIAKEVSVKAFDDILEQFIRNGETSVMHYPRKGCCVIQDVQKYPQMVAHGAGGQVPQKIKLKQPAANLRHNGAYAGSKCFLPSVEREEDKEVSPRDRTIFLTFSKGYPISEGEIIHYFTRMFGDIIESLHMQPVEADNQPLFARIVARCSYMVKAVIERDGPHGKSKYIINGKHVWARKFVPRAPFKDAIEA